MYVYTNIHRPVRITATCKNVRIMCIKFLASVDDIMYFFHCATATDLCENAGYYRHAAVPT